MPTASLDGASRVSLTRHAQAARGAYASNTERALRADTAVFTAWCAEAKLLSVLAAPETLVAFVDDTMGAVQTLQRQAHDGRAQAQAASLARDRIDRMLDTAGTGKLACVTGPSWPSPTTACAGGPNSSRCNSTTWRRGHTGTARWTCGDRRRIRKARAASTIWRQTRCAPFLAGRGGAQRGNPVPVRR